MVVVERVVPPGAVCLLKLEQDGSQLIVKVPGLGDPQLIGAEHGVIIGEIKGVQLRHCPKPSVGWSRYAKTARLSSVRAQNPLCLLVVVGRGFQLSVFSFRFCPFQLCLAIVFPGNERYAVPSAILPA